MRTNGKNYMKKKKKKKNTISKEYHGSLKDVRGTMT